jgi:putative transposase
MCNVLNVSRSGYYAWRSRPPSKRAQEDARLSERICAVHAASHGTYGAPRICAALRAKGARTSRKRVARLMRAAGLQGVSRRTRPGPPQPRPPVAAPAPDRVERDFTAEAPNVVWVADITQVPTEQGVLHVAVVLDVFSRRVVGWSMQAHCRTELVLDGLDQAIAARRPDGVIHHSDRGSQYTSIQFGQRCREAGVLRSMGRAGHCYDNALCESFFATLKTEWVDRHSYATRQEARLSVFTFIEGWYNHHRLHSGLGQQSPVAFEQAYHDRAAIGEALSSHPEAALA